MKYPVKIKYRGKVWARIYANEQGCRLYWRASAVGKDGETKRESKLKAFRTYSEAKTAGDKLAKELHDGSPTTAFTVSQARDALAALQHLESHRLPTGHRLTLLESVSGYCAAVTKLQGHGCTLGEAVDGFLKTVSLVKPVDIGQAVEQFIESRRLKTFPMWVMMLLFILLFFFGGDVDA